ncbi:putative Polycomb group protein ASXL2 isoform X2 [Mizuhopecten yessoensis]|uniref:putative Polycomb group protein ASXL2 isoform X2 n=1 Tax=Mizuhopecten yessoensis TaxID=6573 RepID=UPI000B4585F1|nr:putative Polycomb group protein ASXL2 isoform X2 [Mizuhopecten yessoensis]
MQIDNSKDKQPKRRKSRTWAEAAKIVLERNAQIPMSYKAILQAIQDDNLKDISGSVPLACLNSCLHAYSRGKDSVFYKVAGRSGVYGLMGDRPSGSTLHEVPEENEDDDGRDRPFKERRKENEDDDEQSNGDADEIGEPSDTKESHHRSSSSSSGTSISSHVNHTLRRSMRQSLRQKQKKKQNDYPRIIIKPIPPPDKEKEAKSQKDGHSEMESENDGSFRNGDSKSDSSDSGKSPAPASKRPQTMREILAGIPGFSMKPRRRPHKKLSHAAQIAQTKEGCIDLETPDSILCNTNLRNLIDKRMFSKLPSQYQYKLLHFLPECDRYVGQDNTLRLSSTALNNEFFNKSCQEWIERLSQGEFTPENQVRIKQEEERELGKLDPWKAKHFEEMWGKRNTGYEVPKADLPSPVTPASPVKTKLKKATLVSTMLKQRSIFQTVGSSSDGAAQGGLLMKVSTVKHAISNNDPHKTLKRSLSMPVDPEGHRVLNSVSPAKRQKNPSLSEDVIVDVVSSPEKTVPQVCSPTRVVGTKPVKSVTIVEPAVTQSKHVSILNAITTSPPSVPSHSLHATTPTKASTTLQVTLAHTSRSPVLVGGPTPGVAVRSPPQTRTLAQIRAQNTRGQTRTLAQIKAQTKAKQQLREHLHQQQPETQAKLQAHLIARGRIPASAISSTGSATASRHVPNIMMPAPGRPKQLQPVKGVSTENLTKGTTVSSDVGTDGVNMKRSLEIMQKAAQEGGKDNVNIKRSLEICQKVMKRTQVSGVPQSNNGISTTVTGSADTASSTLPKILGHAQSGAKGISVTGQGQLSASKLLFSNVSTTHSSSTSSEQSLQSRTVSSPVMVNIAKVRTVGTGVQGFSGINNETSLVLTLPQNTALRSTISQTATVLTLPGSNTKVLLPAGIPTSAVTTSSLAQILNAHQAGNNTIRIQPSRASSAPPQNLLVNTNIQTLVRSASAGGQVAAEGNGTIATQNPSEPVNQEIRVISPDQVNFLSKTGTPTAPGRKPPHTTVLPLTMLTQSRPEATAPSPNSGGSAGPGKVTPAQRLKKIVVCSATQIVNNPYIIKSIEAHVQNKANSHAAAAAAAANNQAKKVRCSIVPFVSAQTTSKSVGLSTAGLSGTGLPSTIDNVSTNCACSLKAMIMCKKCGAFCHDDCIGPSNLCVTCLIAT